MEALVYTFPLSLDSRDHFFCYLF
uniref:Photosystem II subunit T n=1 Tax=Pycnocomon intermedium TaxID=398314 RepID=A7DW37_9DIPS|nr:photosystem II subunit T [Pycnocomon intermedium]